MKVLMVSKALVTATYRQKIAELSRLGVDMVVVVPTEWREGGQAQRLEPANDDGYRLLPRSIGWNGHFHLHYYPGLDTVLRQEKPDLVHIDEEPYNLATFLGVRAARKYGLPSLFYAWQNLARAYPPPFRWMERAVYSWASAGMAVSREAEQVLRTKGYRGKSFVVPGFGVDPDRFSPDMREPPRFTIGFPNRLVQAKGIWVLLAVLEQLPDDMCLHIVGDGPLRGDIARWVRERNLGNRVTITTRIPSQEMPDVLRSFSVVVLPSLTTPSWKEQFGRVLIEAMACGVPVIGSDSGEIPHVIGDAGLVVPEGDARALARAIMAIYQGANLRADLARKGRGRVMQHFTQRYIALQTLQAYQQVLTNPR